MSRIKTAVMPEGAIQNYEYDDLDNISKLAEIQGNKIEETSYTYDKKSRTLAKFVESSHFLKGWQESDFISKIYTVRGIKQKIKSGTLGGTMDIVTSTWLILGTSALGFLIVIITTAFAVKGNHKALNDKLIELAKGMERGEKSLKDEICKIREEASLNGKLTREELSNAMKAFNDSFLSRITEIAMLQKNQLDAFAKQLSVLTQLNENKLERMRETVEERLKSLQTDNSQRLEQMRAVVDEKLHATLEKRLGESFKLVSERLEMVHKGLGEMQTLASGVGDLKKVLTNVKTRGIWGEVQLENLLEQILSPQQYEKNVATKKGSERVEFAVKLPAKDGNDGVVYLPIDAKFPLEDYQRLVDAQDQANPQLIEEIGKLLENRIKAEAKDIRDKYLSPPDTTDFGILFLPVEGLYAEVLRRPGLCDLLQREYRVVITGPTTLTALLNSLQMGFRFLAVEKRSSEVWALLGAVKTEFVKFGDVLEKTQKKLQEASNTIDTATRKSRSIQRKLRNIQELSIDESQALLGSLEEQTEETSAL